MKLLCTVILAVLVFAAGNALAKAAEAGAVSLSADSPLARKEHPRLLITRQMVPELRRRCRTVHPDEYRNMLQWADQRVETPIPPALDRLLLRCLNKDPARRPQSVAVLTKLLSSIEVDEPWTEERAEQWWQKHSPEVPACPPPVADSVAEEGVIVS